MTQELQAIIIGGGIGGLAAASALQRAGLSVAVYERATALREIGAGLALWSNALHALDTLAGITPEVPGTACPAVLGIGEAVRMLGKPTTGSTLRTWQGATLMAATTPVMAVQRAELQAALLAALPADTVRLGVECVGFEQDAEGVTVRFADGATARGDLLVGADGLRSVVRASMFGPAQPHYAGYTAWRGVAQSDAIHVPPGESWGYGERFGMLPMSRGRIYWYATVNAPEGAPDAPMGRKRELQARFSGWHEPIPEVIAATPAAAILHNDIYDRRPLRRWGVGIRNHGAGYRVTLLGDAAHPMTPDLGQGACQAIEDAVVLARCLAQKETVAAALHAYEAARMPRTRAILLSSRQWGQIGQWESRWTCGLRNALLRILPTALRARQMAWIVDYRL